MSPFLIGGGDGYEFEPLEHFPYSKYNIHFHECVLVLSVFISENNTMHDE